MKTRIILFLLCLITMNVMGQTNGTITRQRKKLTSPKKTTPTASATSTSRPKLTLSNLMNNMVYVEGGTFTMGATSEQQNPEDDEKPIHQVTLSSFYICKYEVTQALWKEVMVNNPSKWIGDNIPVQCVSWTDCQSFIRKLNSMTGKNFRLPTEAEWEYAARGGTLSRGYQYSGSNILEDVAWYDGNSKNEPRNVGMKVPNELGLYDMSGNVWEWCQDWYGNYNSNIQTNPSGPSIGTNRVNRGGSWLSYAWNCRVVDRNVIASGSSSFFLGFRLALSE